jgi:ABC-2 type transport system permease protein
VVRTIRLEDSGLEPALVNKLIRDVGLKTYKVSSRGEESEDRGATFAMTYIMVFMLYMVILIYGASISRKVLEEKTTRVIEMVVSSVKPFQLMAGKILGVGSAGLLQFSLWAGFMLLASSYRVKIGEAFGLDPSQLTGLPSLPYSVLVFYVVFFILGYLLFSTLYAAIGAMVNSDQEAQQLSMPIVMFLVLPMVMMIYIIRAPDSVLSVTLSMIPFFAPTIMFMRISIMMPPWWEVALSLGILLATILAMVWLSGKIFRVGILMYGKRPSLPEIVKWLRYS